MDIVSTNVTNTKLKNLSNTISTNMTDTIPRNITSTVSINSNDKKVISKKVIALLTVCCYSYTFIVVRNHFHWLLLLSCKSKTNNILLY